MVKVKHIWKSKKSFERVSEKFRACLEKVSSAFTTCGDTSFERKVSVYRNENRFVFINISEMFRALDTTCSDTSYEIGTFF